MSLIILKFIWRTPASKKANQKTYSWSGYHWTDRYKSLHAG